MLAKLRVHLDNGVYDGTIRDSQMPAICAYLHKAIAIQFRYKGRCVEFKEKYLHKTGRRSKAEPNLDISIAMHYLQSVFSKQNSINISSHKLQ